MTQPSHLTFADMYQQHDVYAAFPQEYRQAGALPVDFVQVEQTDFEAIDPATHTFAVGIILRGHACFEVDFGEGMRQIATADNTPTGVYLHPTLSDTLYRQVGYYNLLFISAPLADIAAKLEVEASVLNHALRPLHDSVLPDSRIRTHCLTLWEQATQAGPFASLAVDQGLLALVAMLMARARPGRITAAPPTPGLDAEQLGRVRDYVQALLEQPFNLSDLADVAGLSLSLFSRTFKAATGQSPHQYVLSQRVQRARELLAFSHLSIAEIAAACGFYDQAHLTRIFKKQLGTTPGDYRQEVQG
ncbi:helix-turn-helix domain-containing protein [Vacuolonema iberomarrocanum]|uniref:helix-turn-helix domain-containing protein n=1 Tax=Vacuolonema iberomarrocanum TaxID=3454632 RepID=UPI0019FDF759|nr:helix-turn-helix transcriptional regulator [filamentous cyanobacterium LEGE 07170]